MLMFRTLEPGPSLMLTTRPRSDALGAAASRLAHLGALALIVAAPWASAQLSNIRPQSPLPDATIRQFYSVTFTPVNPYKGLPVLWNITPGCLDGTGLAFTPQNGTANAARINGVPTRLGTFDCTIVAQDAGDNVISKPYELTIVKGCVSPRITSSPPPAAVEPGATYSYVIVAVGSLPRTFAALGLPPGLSIDPLTGVIAGTTAAAGAYSVTVIVKGCGREAIQNFTLVVGTAPVSLALSSAPNPAVFGQDIAVAVHATGGAVAPSGTVLLCVLAAGEFCAAPVGTPPAATPPELIPPLYSASLDAGGNVTFTLRGLPIQNYVLQAYYAGDSTHAEARSVPVDQFVIKGALLPPSRRSQGAPAPPGASVESIPALSMPMLGALSMAIVGIAVGVARRRG